MFFRYERGHFVQEEKRAGICAGRAGKFSNRNKLLEGQPEMAAGVDQSSAQIASGLPAARLPGRVRCLETAFRVSFKRTRAQKAGDLNKYS